MTVLMCQPEVATRWASFEGFRVEAPSATATVRVTRAASLVVGGAPSYDVLVDGVRIGVVREGAMADLTVAAGRHELSIRSGWSTSAPVTFEIGGTERLDVTCAPSVLVGGRPQLGPIRPPTVVC